MSLPDFGATPAFSGAGSAQATAASNLYNAQLALNLATLQGEGLNIIGFEVQSTLQDILDDINAGGVKYGILDGTNPCTAAWPDLQAENQLIKCPLWKHRGIFCRGEITGPVAKVRIS